MKSDRFFFSAAAALNLLIMLVGFWPYSTSGHGQHGRVIAPEIYTVVLVHGLAITAWYLLSLAQSLLITVKNRALHMKLGWSAVGLTPVVAVSGVLVAVRSAAGSPGFVFFGMDYPHDFLLVMLTEIAVFTLLVAAGLAWRKRPDRHRALMLGASFSLLLGATTRIPPLVELFGGHDSRVAFFGPVFALAAVLLVVRSLLIRAFDRWFAASYAFIVVVYLAAGQLGHTAAWHQLAEQLIGN